MDDDTGVCAARQYLQSLASETANAMPCRVFGSSTFVSALMKSEPAGENIRVHRHQFVPVRYKAEILAHLLNNRRRLDRKVRDCGNVDSCKTTSLVLGEENGLG